ncbi:MAG: putative rane protein precursor [Devosia sp.]|nr:putative rane protein precursor [Devosia sp.]
MLRMVSRHCSTGQPWLLAFLTLLLFAVPAIAREEIRGFDSNVVLATDGTVTVTETIEVTAEGNSIRRGIFRDIPTVLINDDGSRLRSDLDVLEVLRDGKAEPYSTESIQGGIRIRIGDPDVLISTGPHRYRVKYTSTRMARFFIDHDELYWNATGNYWEFPIRRATATLTLPEGAVVRQSGGYTGGFGSTESNVEIVPGATPNTISFKLTSPLAPYEGMSVFVNFPKGVVAEPDGATAFWYWLSDHRDLILPALSVLIVLGYFLYAWNAVGRDPARGTIVPLFHPPKGFSPALAHFVHYMGWQQTGWTAFTSAIFDLGAKGLLTIDNAGKALRLTLTNARPDALPAGEKLVYDHIAASGTLTIDTTTGPKLNAKRGEFIATIEKENRQVYFKNNFGYIIVGFLLSMACLLLMALTGVLDWVWLGAAAFAGVFLGLFTGVFKSLWTGAGISKIGIGIGIVIVLINLGGSIASIFSGLSFSAAIIGAASITLTNVIFAVLMRAPTVQGRKVMDQIEGFRMYMDTAEENRLNIVAEPPLTVERFEGILPFAIALGVEKPWSKHFEAALALNAVAGATAGAYRPLWYSGSSFSPGKLSNSVASVAAGMSAAMIAAQPVSSSSSGGGGGGGFSGGGGGGGGGGGW